MIIGALLILASAALFWLVVTNRWHFPILFDIGLTLVGLGALGNGLHLISTNEMNDRALVVVGSGAILMIWSYFRKMRYLNRIHRSKLRHIDGSIMREVRR